MPTPISLQIPATPTIKGACLETNGLEPVVCRTPMESPRDCRSCRIKQLQGDDDDPSNEESDECIVKDYESDGIVQVLVAWLNREVKTELRSIDIKLGELIANSKHESFPLSCLRSPRVLSFPVAHGASLEEKSLRSNTFYMRQLAGDVAPLYPDGTGNNSTFENGSPTNMTGVDAETLHTSGSRRSTMSTLLGVNKHPSLEAKMHLIRETISAHKTRRGRFAAKLWRFLEDRYSSTTAYVYSFFVPLVVMASVFVSFWQTVPGCPLRGLFGEILQTCFETVFALELCTRCFVCPDRVRFWRDTLNFIDLFSAMPILFRITIGIMSIWSEQKSADDELSTVALLPVLRLLKLTRRFETFQLLLSAFMIAIEALPVLLYTLIVIALVFSALIYWAEPVENIANLPQALWFIIVTMTTVGYGDITPDTLFGHIVTTILMIISGLYMAIPIGIVGNAFSQAWGARDRLLLMQRLREAFLQQGFSQKALYDIVNLFDSDGDGELGFDEFNTMLEAMHIHIGRERVYLLLESLDNDKSGKISVDELMNGLFPRDYKEFFATLTIARAERTSSLDTNCRYVVDRTPSHKREHYASFSPSGTDVSPLTSMDRSLSRSHAVVALRSDGKSCGSKRPNAVSPNACVSSNAARISQTSYDAVRLRNSMESSGSYAVQSESAQSPELVGRAVV